MSLIDEGIRDKLFGSVQKNAPRVRKVKLSKDVTFAVPCNADGDIACQKLKAVLSRSIGMQKIRKHPARAK